MVRNIDLVTSGVEVYIPSGTGGNIGIGFAVPVNLAESVMDQLVQYGEVRRGVLGVQIQDLTADLAQAMGIDQQNGVLVTRVMPNSAAAQAGLQQGDVITAVNGDPVEAANELAMAIGMRESGSEVTLQVIRDGSEQTITVTLGGSQQPQQQAGTGEKVSGCLSLISAQRYTMRLKAYCGRRCATERQSSPVPEAR